MPASPMSDPPFTTPDPANYKTITAHFARITRITLNRPEKRNAINLQMEADLVDALRRAERYPDARVVLLTGAGPVFSAGHDLQEAAARAAGQPIPSSPFGVHPAPEEVWNVALPIVTAVHGYVGPHAIKTITATDLIVAAHGTRFSWEITARAGGPSFPLLTFTVGLRNYKRWLLTDPIFDAEAALQAGLINKVVPPDKLLDEALAWCETIAQTAPESARGNKLSINKDLDRLGLWDLHKLQSRHAPHNPALQDPATYRSRLRNPDA